jgi:DNA-binding GntR family transcriptional regulator
MASQLPRPNSKTASGAVYDRLRAEIMSGALMPGDLAVEDQLAKFLQISRTPVREALLRLEREGLLERSGRSLAVRVFSSDEVADIYSLRAHIESYAARLATQRIMDHELAELGRIQQAMLDVTEQHRREPTLDTLREITQHNERFHRLVIRAARSPALDQTMSGLMLTPLLYRAQQWYDDNDRSRAAHGHEELLEHMREGDAAAAEACWREHLTGARDRILAKQISFESNAAPRLEPQL